MKTKKFLSMAALALVGAMMTGCSSDDNFDNPQQPENKSNVVTLTTTVGFADGATTRALTIDGNKGVKSFGAGDQMAVIYHNGTSFVKAVSHALEAGDITNEGKNATFTFDLETPNKSGDVLYIYPAAMAGDTGVDITKLNTQEGTFDALQSKYDLCTNFGAWDGDNLPSLTLENLLAILAINLKNEEGSSDITSTITDMTISDGTNTYAVTRETGAGPIYVAILPTTSANISIEAISGGKGYCKTLATKTYAASNGYQVSWKMTPATLLSTISSDYTAQNGETLYGKLGSNVKISIADGATVTLKDVTINGVNSGSYAWAGITCAGDATITLEGTNTVKGFHAFYPGIYVPEDHTLTIEGEGSLNASGNGPSTGIGGGFYMHCGDIVINGGNITATGGNFNAGIGGGGVNFGDEGTVIRCGKITINGGTVTATCGESAAGIGCGYNGASNDITITGGTVTATGGEWAAGIGSGEGGSCGAINISGGTVTAMGGKCSAGIGGGNNNGASGDITITSGVTQVTATKGSNCLNSIGEGDGGAFITVIIEDYDKVIQN